MSKSYLFLVSILASSVTSVYAAKPIDLENKPAHYLQSFLNNHHSFKEIKSAKDLNQTTHIRMQQMYQGIPVLGGDVIVHIPQNNNVLANAASASGTMYQNLENDLNNKILSKINSEETKLKAIQTIAKRFAKEKNLRAHALDLEDSHVVIYIDATNKAHYAYYISFIIQNIKGLPEKPTFIVDAETFEVYQSWDNIQTLEAAAGGGYGGNKKTGKLTYDGLANHLPQLKIDKIGTNCLLQNPDITVKDRRSNDTVVQYTCDTADKDHNNVYWNGEHDAINGAFSPANDALYVGQIIKGMYQDWYHIPVLSDANGPMMLNMRVHEDMENAYWDGKQMTFGDGGDMFYPLVSLGVGAHEVSHGFTQQHSNLFYFGQPGGINESFSDMAAVSAEFYSSGQNQWQIGPEIAKEDIALRYMDEPTKDCKGKTPGQQCSIDNASDFHFGLNVHYSSGVFNKAFYLLSTAEGWNTRKAFDVMVQANQFYWTALSNFNSAACGVVKATRDLKYSTDAVVKAFSAVGISVSAC